jgi:hypothetical protein
MIWRLGFDSFVELASDWSSAIRTEHERWVAHLGDIRELVGDYSRVAAAFEGVEVRSREEMSRFVASRRQRLAYKQTENYYGHWKGSIYR